MIRNVGRKEILEHSIDGEDLDGYPIYNQCDHTLLDLRNFDPKKEWMHSISALLPNGRKVAVCIMQSSSTQSCVDVRYYRNEDEEKTWAVGFKKGKSESIGDNNTFAIICDVKRGESL